MDGDRGDREFLLYRRGAIRNVEVYDANEQRSDIGPTL